MTGRATHRVRLDVLYQDDGDAKLVGRLGADARGIMHFEYDPAWVAGGIELSPHQLPLTLGSTVVRAPDPRQLHGLHGLFADSLPDQWGMHVMNRALSRAGHDPMQVSALDRLTYLGDRTMGALTYRPATGPTARGAAPMSLEQLVADADAFAEQRIGESAPTATIDTLERVAGTAGGAQPKALIAVAKDGETLHAGTAPHRSAEQYLLKFTPRKDGLGLRPDCGSIEEAFAAMARAAGVRMGRTRLFSTSDGRWHFATERFDRTSTRGRRHVHTYGGLMGREASDGGDYDELLRVTRALTGDARQIDEVVLRLAFNVSVLNDDDHAKNTAFRLDPTTGWELSPAYDLTYAPSRAGERGMSVLGKEEDVTWADITTLALQHGVSKSRAREIRESVAAALARWPEFAAAAHVPDASVAELAMAFARRAEALAG